MAKRGWSPLPDALDSKPWYRQFWPWVLIFLPMSAVVAGLSTVYIAMQDPDGLVVDDYYKAGLAINKRLAREQAARDMGIAGVVTLDRGTGDLIVELVSASVLDREALSLQLLHATRAKNDVSLVLRRQAPGRYAGALEASLKSGAWDMVLNPEDADWRIVGRIYIRDDGQTTVSGELTP